MNVEVVLGSSFQCLMFPSNNRIIYLLHNDSLCGTPFQLNYVAQQ